MQTVFTGRVTVLGNNIDTDQIYPGRYLELVDPVEIGHHCLEGVDGDLAKNFRQGDFLVAGSNFGCGSSREHAPIAILNMGALLVLADSFARIFYRNGINLGLPLVICKGLWKQVKDGDWITVDLEQGTVRLEAAGTVMTCEKIQGPALTILQAGGIKPLFRQRMSQSSQ